MSRHIAANLQKLKRIQRKLRRSVNLDLALVNSAGSAGGRAVDQERRALDLLDVVETGDTDVAIREGLDGSLDFGEDFVQNKEYEQKKRNR